MASAESRAGRSFDPAAPVEHVPGRYVTGLLPGLYAGAMMALCVLILTAARGAPIGQPFRLVASVLMGSRAMTGGSGAVVFGVVLHFITSAVLGMIFTRVFGPMTMRRLLGCGLAYSIFLWMIAQFLLLPWANPLFAEKLGTVWPFFVGHLAYGVSLASTVPSVHDIDAVPEPDVTTRVRRRVT
jgi:hypothetical protein